MTKPSVFTRAVLCVALGAATAACSSEEPPPTSPSPPPAVDLDYTRTPLALTSERHLLQLNGPDLSPDLARQECTPLGLPSVGKWLTTFLWFEREGDEWVGRSRPPYVSTLTMRLRRVSSSILGVAVEGNIEGSASDEFDPVMGKLDLVFDVEQDGRLEGTLSPAAAGGAVPSRLGGWLRGHFSFAGSAREVATCTSVQFYLEPRPPGPPFD